MSYFSLMKHGKPNDPLTENNCLGPNPLEFIVHFDRRYISLFR